MSVEAVVGLQWGDEGKGRIVDYLAGMAEFVIRYQGGDNAGHTVINRYGRFALHIVPSGIFNAGTCNIVSAGTVVNFSTMGEELDRIEASLCRKVNNLYIDSRAHLILPYHCLLDGAEENGRDENLRIGTTKRGIGPCYADKASRIGLRAGDLLNEQWLEKRLSPVLEQKNRELSYYGLKTFSLNEMLNLCMAWRDRFGNSIIDSLPILRKAMAENRSILLEGQLGIMRDNDWGIYPYTTSSNPSASGACVGAGIPPTSISRIVGVMKAYSTSVGGGPYVAELKDETGSMLRELGGEYGATTGRARRCGWLDLVAVDYACFLNGVTDIALTKLDILDSFDRIKVCTAYDVDGKIYDNLPDTLSQQKARPVFEDFEGWGSDTSHCRSWNELPQKAKDYVDFIENRLGRRISYISVGPERDQIIVR